MKLTSCLPIVLGLKCTGMSKVEFGSTLNSFKVSNGPPDTSDRTSHISSELDKDNNNILLLKG